MEDLQANSYYGSTSTKCLYNPEKNKKLFSKHQLCELLTVNNVVIHVLTNDSFPHLAFFTIPILFNQFGPSLQYSYQC